MMAADNTPSIYSPDAEMAVLGSILIDPTLISAVRAIVNPDDFYLPQHKEICEIIFDLEGEGKNVDAILVANQLEWQGIFDEAGGRKYLFQIAQSVPSTANVVSYARIVAEKRRVRNAVSIAQSLASAGDASHIDDLRGMALQLDEALAEPEANDSNCFDNFIAGLGKKKPRILTGLSDVDRMIGGLRIPSLSCVGATPGSGKTTFALNIALNNLRGSRKVTFFSVEMDTDQINERISSCIERIDYDRFTRQDVTQEAARKAERAINSIRDRFVLYDDVDDIERMQSIVKAVKPTLVVIDYMQIVRTSKSTDSRRLEVDHIIRECKMMAKRNNCHVMMLSQLRKSERPGAKPNNEDLKETGAFLECSDYVFLLHRPFLTTRDPADVHAATVCVSKNKFGAIGDRELYFEGEFQRFRCLNENAPEPPPMPEPKRLPPASQPDFEEIVTGDDLPF